MRIIFTRIGCTLLTCDMYMNDLRHIHDPVLSSLKMDDTRFFFSTNISTEYFIHYNVFNFSVTFK
jgi:hypothetical protein